MYYISTRGQMYENEDASHRWLRQRQALDKRRSDTLVTTIQLGSTIVTKSVSEEFETFRVAVMNLHMNLHKCPTDEEWISHRIICLESEKAKGLVVLYILYCPQSRQLSLQSLTFC